MLDEYDVIELMTRGFGKLPEGYLPIGDDVAMFPSGGPGQRVVMKCDMLVAKTDVPRSMTWRQASRKSIAMCVSDFAAKGVRPTAFMVSLGLPRGTPKRRVEELASGILDASREWDVRLVGGDTGETHDLTIDCSMVGFADRVVQRSGARAGELVVTTGTFGQTAAGLKILSGRARAEPVFREEAVSSVCRPAPKLSLGIALSKILSSSIDSSDGLAISLHSICEMSRVGIRLAKLPVANGLSEFASRNSVSAEELALYGGEEYEIVGTINKGRIEEAKDIARSMGCELIVIGETMSTKEERGVVLPNNKRVLKKGWIHFKSEP